METSMRNLIVDAPGSLGSRYRQRRWDAFIERFPNLDEMTVLDLGGRADTWTASPIRPRQVVVVNLGDFVADVPDWVVQESGDACEFRADGREFDLVYSNSVIEHVGGHQRRAMFAQVVRDAAPRHWVQTPYRYFPVEPHWLFPGFQFMPVAARASVAQRWRLSHSPPASREAALRTVMEVELVSVSEMAWYFPESTIVRERVGPFTKSLIATVS